MKDTSPEMEKIQRDLIMAKTPGERFLMAIEMFEMAKTMVENAVRSQHKDFDEKQVKREVFRRFYLNDFSPEEMEKILAQL